MRTEARCSTPGFEDGGRSPRPTKVRNAAVVAGQAEWISPRERCPADTLIWA